VNGAALSQVGPVKSPMQVQEQSGLQMPWSLPLQKLDALQSVQAPSLGTQAPQQRW
jgi:hypothetical protein